MRLIILIIAIPFLLLDIFIERFKMFIKKYVKVAIIGIEDLFGVDYEKKHPTKKGHLIYGCDNFKQYKFSKKYGYAKRNNWVFKKYIFGIAINVIPRSFDIHTHNMYKDVKKKKK
jgi:hypothetical protein